MPGAGPQQLAVALLADVLGERELHAYNPGDFTGEVIAKLPRSGWMLRSVDIQAWVGTAKRHPPDLVAHYLKYARKYT